MLLEANMVGRNVPEGQRLSELVPHDIFVGTSLILRQDNRLLYGIRPPREEGKRPVLELTGIGGGLEEGESLTTGVMREAQEEIGCDVRLLPCRETIVVRGPHLLERASLHGEERPAAVVFRAYRTPPHQPWHPDNQGDACLIVFLGQLLGRPTPVAQAELPALLWLKPAHVVATARQDVPLQDLIDTGAQLDEGPIGHLPRTGCVRLTDSQEALVIALGDSALPFYETLLEG
jgi:8-oxo-dGTP pyrophosphatase MutT (NUDIX family)